ncbi:hypothetical protein HN51_025912, partial [Arachis hypogaea]
MELRSMSDVLQFHAQLLKGSTQNDDALRNISKLFTFAALSPTEETVELLGKYDLYFFSYEHPPLTELAQKALDWAVDEKLKS